MTGAATPHSGPGLHGATGLVALYVGHHALRNCSDLLKSSAVFSSLRRATGPVVDVVLRSATGPFSFAVVSHAALSKILPSHNMEGNGGAFAWVQKLFAGVQK